MKKIIFVFSLFNFTLLTAQISPLEDHLWRLEKIVTVDSTLVVPNNLIFNGLFESPDYYRFGNCVFVDGNLAYNDNMQSFVINFSSIPFEVCPDEEDLMDIEDFFQNEFFFDTFMVSWHEPFSYTFTITQNKIYLDITNSEGSIATFYDNLLSTEEFLENQMAIFPNPVKDMLYVDVSNADSFKFTIYDLNGRGVLILDSLEKGQLDLTDLSKGVYILKIETNTGVFTNKFIKN